MSRAGWIAAGAGVLLAGGGLLAGKAFAGTRGTRTSREYGVQPPPSSPPPPPLPPHPAPPIAYPSGVPVVAPGYTMQVWVPVIGSIIATSYPRVRLDFAMKWAEIESGGNPGAVGDPGQLGPDDQPAEIGLGQLYNPDDFRAFGQDPAAYRVYCPAAKPLALAYRQAKAERDQAKASGDTQGEAAAQAQMNRLARAIQSVTRTLTASEMDAQARWTLLAKIDQGVTIADRVVAQYSLSHWSLQDFWKLVKAPHALPAILNQGMPAVVKKLGRGPSSWAEFRTTLGMEGNSAWHRALNACETCGNAVAPAVA